MVKGEVELPAFGRLYDRAVANGSPVRRIDAQELRDIEPHALTCGEALYSPETAVVDPRAILGALRADLQASGKVRFRLGVKVLGPKGPKKSC